MAWTDRQRRMLAEMGLPSWLAPAGSPDESAEPPATAVAAQPAPAVAAQPAVASPLPMRAAAPVAPGPARPAPAPPVAPQTTRPPDAVAMLDWAGLRDAVAACTACGLCESRTQTVFGVGNRSAEWMIVGEAPGEQEDRQGEPFVGRSGQLLDNMLLALGLSRAEGAADRQVYIANTLKCRPPGNRNPSADELARCEPFLVRQIELIRPRIILAMGRFAVQSLLRSNEPIGRLRGRVHHYQGVPLVVTYHPAYLLRNPLDKARAWDDLCLAAETAAAATGPINAIS